MFFLVKRRPPRSTRTDTLFPYTTLFRSSTCTAVAKRIEEDFITPSSQLSPCDTPPSAPGRPPRSEVRTMRRGRYRRRRCGRRMAEGSRQDWLSATRRAGGGRRKDAVRRTPPEIGRAKG